MMIFTAALAAFMQPAAQPNLAEWVTRVRDRYPSLSPDGQHLLFESDRSGRNALYVSKPDGTDIRLLVGGDGEPSGGSWSSDGSRILFHERVGKELDVFVVRADGSGKRNLTNSPFEEGHPHWGRDGRVYFNSDRATRDRAVAWGERNHNLFSMAADGSDVRQLTRCDGVCTNPNPSPDGLSVAFRLGLREAALSWAQRPSPMNSEIGVLDLRTGAIRNITNHRAYDTWPSWSPDSKWVAYGSNRDGVANVGQLYMTRADGARTKRLTDSPASYGEPSFSPDGNTLYFSKSLPASGSRASFIASLPVPPE